MNKKKFLSDSILGIAASSIPIITIQFLVFPLLSNQVGESTFGFIITMVGVFGIIAGTFGSVTNNARLVLNSEYEKEQVTGDFNLLLWISCCIGFVAALICAIILDDSLLGFGIVGIVFFSFIPIINILSTYYLAAFRLKISFCRILINSLIESIGYISGYGLFILTGYWQLIYILGFGFCLVYHAILRNPLMFEPLCTTRLFKKTTRYMLILVLAAFLNSSLTYLDRLVLFPLLGGEAVSVYYVSTVIGKIIPLAIGPIAGVMLAYFSKMSLISRSTILHILLISSAAGVVGFVVCIFISSPLLSVLYPSIAEEAIQYIYITTLTAMINMLCVILSPIVLKFYDIIWQIKIIAINIFVYIVLSLVLSVSYGLLGFCIGVLAATTIKFACMAAICLYSKSSLQR